MIYLGLVALWQVFEDPGRAARAAAIFTLTAVVIIPIIHFSVVWWNTLHQSASFGLNGSAVARPMLWPLFTMVVAFTTLFFTLHLAAIRNEILRRRLRRLSILEASGAEAAASGRAPNLGLAGYGRTPASSSPPTSSPRW